MHTKRTTYARALALGLLVMSACGVDLDHGRGRQPNSQSAAMPISSPTSTPTVSEATSGQVQAESSTTASTATTEPMATTVPTTEPEPTTVPKPLPRLAPPSVTVPTIPAPVVIDGMPARLRRIGGCESSWDPDGPLLWGQANLQGSTASGAFQVLDSTWRSWAQTYGADTDATEYSRAMYAPAGTQLTVAIRAHAAEGATPWVSSRACWG